MSAGQRVEIFEQYIEADAPGRAALFRDFLRALKSLGLEGAVDEAVGWARRAVSPDLDYASHVALRKVLQRAVPPDGALRLAVLGGPTTTQLVWLLENFLAGHGIEARIWQGEYGLFRQALLTPDPGLDAFRPQVVFLATDARDVVEGPALTADGGEVAARVEEEFEQWRRLWLAANERWGAQVIQNLFDIPPWGTLGHYARRAAASRERHLARINERMADGAPGFVLLQDLPMLALEAGASAWFDPRFYHEAKMPCGPECLVAYAHSVASQVAAIKGRSRKVLVLDLDNTLWGGVVGDDGVGGIRVGQGSAEGESYLAFQQYLKRMAARGILLAVCSKNEAANAREPFEKLPDMALRLEDFACFVANWENKADNIRRIADELSLGADSFVFVDDNPAERAIVRRYLPQVAVPDMPADPAEFVHAVARHRYFEVAALTAEDLQRAAFYAQNRQRREMASAHTDVAGFLASLEMQAQAGPITPLNIERSTQLINKSNQFNLTTRRYTQAEIEVRRSSPAWFTLTVTLRDRLGDNGLISVVLAEVRGSELVIDTWVMSCRVLQRGVESLVAAILLEAARRRGCAAIRGTYIPTAKNGMVRDHFARLGFDPAGSGTDGATEWLRSVPPEPQVVGGAIACAWEEAGWKLPDGGG